MLLWWWVRLHNLLQLPAFIDEGAHLQWARLVWHLQPFHSASDGKLLGIWLGAAFWPFAGGLWLLRVAGLLVGVCGFAALLATARRWLGARAAVAAAALLIVLPHAHFFERMAVADAVSSAFLVYGIALVYGATQATSFAGIGMALDAGRATSPLLLAGVGLIMVGMGFKVAAVPFHMWTPDVYDGSPSVVTAFMSVGAKAAGFAALVRVLFDALAPLALEWGVVVATLAALSMVLGNVAAIPQTSMKRMLAYSSIAHAGYVAVAALIDAQGALSNFSAGAAIFYLGAYALTNLGTWAVVLAVEKPGRMTTDVADYAGLGRTQPALAAAMTLFMLSLTGLPPSIGFVAKFYVFRAALEAGYTWLVLLGVVTVLISAYYYLRVIVVMWMKEGMGEAVLPRALNFTIWLTAAGTLVFGIVPGPLMSFVESSVRGIF